MLVLEVYGADPVSYIILEAINIRKKTPFIKLILLGAIVSYQNTTARENT